MSPDSLIPALADMDELNVDSALQLASEVATVNLLFAQQELGRRIVDPNVTSRALLDIAEHSYKVSGMQKKQEPKEQQGRFVFNINFRGETMTISKETDMIDVTPEPSPMDLVREAAAIASDDTTKNKLTRKQIDFDDAPEFC